MNKKYYWELVEEFGSLRGKGQMEDFLGGILTLQELEQLTKRLQIVKKLKKGEAQREIAEDLNVGIATVTRGARELKNGRFSYV